MIFEKTSINGVIEINNEKIYDNRGYFERLFCEEQFKIYGISFQCCQISISSNYSRHTLRGMHWQDPPYSEAKIVRVVRGSIFDVVVDLRKDSSTYKKWISLTLDYENGKSLYIPEGCAHGFLTLEDQTDVLYQMRDIHVQGYARGFRWNDEDIGISWPSAPEVMSQIDKELPLFKDIR